MTRSERENWLCNIQETATAVARQTSWGTVKSVLWRYGASSIEELKQAPIISWDGLTESGYEPAAGASPEESTMTKSEYEIIKAAMDAEDIRIAKAFEMKELFGFSVREIAAEFQLSESRVYQLIARAKAIGREYRQENG